MDAPAFAAGLTIPFHATASNPDSLFPRWLQAGVAGPVSRASHRQGPQPARISGSDEVARWVVGQATVQRLRGMGRCG